MRFLCKNEMIWFHLLMLVCVQLFYFLHFFPSLLIQSLRSQLFRMPLLTQLYLTISFRNLQLWMAENIKSMRDTNCDAYDSYFSIKNKKISWKNENEENDWAFVFVVKENDEKKRKVCEVFLFFIFCCCFHFTWWMLEKC